MSLRALVSLFSVLAWNAPAFAAPQNIILMVGDGMGPEHVRAARLYEGAPLPFEAAPHQALMTTDSYRGAVTDSAASATAMATGEKVLNFTISVAFPGDFSDLETQLLAAHLPLLLHEDPRDVLVIGLASGITAGSAATHPVELIRIAEIYKRWNFTC